MKKPHFTIESVTGKPYFKVEDAEHIYFIPDKLRPDVEAYLKRESFDSAHQSDLTNWYLSLPHHEKTALIVAVNKNIA
ncbi:MAG TPA: hypothetical protein VD993_05035 [Chitinophagaceae bacterium]|nr:hypothetical protein [Chitinophagaceae bacterium]